MKPASGKMSQNILAGWQSGYAPDCKSVYVGSIPASASIYPVLITWIGVLKPLSGEPSGCTRCPGGEIGRRKGLKIPRPKGRAGSTPAPGTISPVFLVPVLVLRFTRSVDFVCGKQ